MIEVQCTVCGCYHEEQQDPTVPFDTGDYAEFPCPDCGAETEHIVVVLTANWRSGSWTS